jgi:phospholipid/cholesterol/gamma-HCH transport system ATP-binding protein
MVFQQSALFDSLTVEENVGFVLYQHSKLSRSRIRDLVHQKLEMVGLSHTGDPILTSCQVGCVDESVLPVRLCTTLKIKARSFTYDEPTAGLDPIASTVIEDLIRQLQCTQGICGTYAIVTHQNSTIRRTADRLVFSIKVNCNGRAG